jgi:putative copper export protein
LSVLLAVAAIDEGERVTFAARVVPRLNRLNLVAIVLLPSSGIANLYYVGRAHSFRLPSTFVDILTAKLALLCGMAVALGLAWGGEAPNPASPRNGTQRLLWSYGAMAAMGAAALLLGLWLAGSA